MSTGLRGNATSGRGAGALTPGEHLRAEIERLGLDQVAVSQATGVSRQSINNIVNGRQPVSRAMAGKLGRLTGHSSDYWLRASFPRGDVTNASHAKSAAALSTATRPLGVGVLVNHQIARAVKEGVIAIEPFEAKNVQLASIDLTLDDFIVTADGDEIDVSGGQSFFLETGRSVNVSTREWVELPQDYIGRAGALASLAKNGIMTSQGFQIGPGFKGNLQFCVFNAGPGNFELRSGNAIVGLELMPLSATPTPDERASTRSGEASDHDKVVPLFGNDVCERLIREAICARVQVDPGHDGAKAQIAELNIEILDASAEAARDDAVDCALSGLKTLREKPNAARQDREKYTRFFAAIAEHLYLSGEQARRATVCLGLPAGDDDTLIATLRDGGEAIVSLPTKSAKISLRQLGRQLREDPLDLMLMLAGLMQYSPARD
jgi:deoxycytidine triphosphate deaminase/addiction module HigA family antidote